jgi:predicted transcriptional regulator
MTSDKVMKKIISVMGNTPMSVKSIAHKVDRHENNVYRDLKAMEELGLIRRLEKEGKGSYQYMINNIG